MRRAPPEQDQGGLPRALHGGTVRETARLYVQGADPGSTGQPIWKARQKSVSGHATTCDNAQKDLPASSVHVK